MNPHGCNQCGSWVIGHLDVVRVQALANIHVPRGPGLADADVPGRPNVELLQVGKILVPGGTMLTSRKPPSNPPERV